MSTEASADWECLDIVNCTRSRPELEESQAYISPARGRTYEHRRCRYFGVYFDKSVRYIAQIEALVDVTAPGQAVILWQNAPGAGDDYKRRALGLVQQYRRTEALPQRVFLLGPLYVTNFPKDSPGGMQGTKQYLPVTDLKAQSALDLARKLQGRRWSQFGL